MVRRNQAEEPDGGILVGEGCSGAGDCGGGGGGVMLHTGALSFSLSLILGFSNSMS